MRYLNQISNSPLQRFIVVTETGDAVAMTLRYMPTQQQWTISIAWGEYAINGLSLVVAPNLLFGYSNILPFGLMVTSDTDFEPSYLDDFTSGRIKLYILTADDVVAVDDGIVA